MKGRRKALAIELVVLLLAGAAGSAHAARYELQPSASLPMDYTYDVAIGDVTGDGREDVVALDIGAWNPSSLHVYPQLEDGTLGAPIKLENAWGMSLVLADVNNDAVSDIVIGDSDGIRFFLADGAGGFDSHLAWPQPQKTCKDIAALHVDDDGVLDFACNGSGFTLMLFFGDGAGGIRSTRWSAGSGTHFDMKSGDLDNDGHADLLTLSLSDDFEIRHGNGTTLEEPLVLAHADDPLVGMAAAIGDFDGNGLDDVVLAGAGSDPGHLRLYQQREATGLASPIIIAVEPGIIDLQATDLEGDGDVDLLATRDRTHQSLGASVSVFTQVDGALQPERQVPLGSGIRNHAFAAGDVDSDGCKDVALGERWNEALVVLRGTCPDAVSDLDGDRRSDLFWRNVSTGGNVVWRGADHAAQFEVADTAPHWVVGGLGDFDGDGRDDVLWRNNANGLNQVWSAGNHEARIPILNVRDIRWKVAGIGDLDGDGKDDVVWRHFVDGRNQVWLSANARTPQRIFAVRNIHWGIAGVADFDGDGSDDLLWHNEETGANTIWRNGNPRAQDNITDITDLAWDIAGVGDFDGDGRGDILWRHSVDGRNVVWRGGRFDDAMLVRTVADPDWQVAAVGDYDGDGESDIVWRHARSGRNSLWRSADPDTQLPVTNVLDTGWEIVD